MTSKPYPWFRFYSEALRDRKLEAACRIAEQPKGIILATWVTILALANDSPIRGFLLLTEKIPLEAVDIERETGFGMEVTESVIDAFLEIELLVTDEVFNAYCIKAWNKRQFESDSSTERTRRYRERKRQQETSQERSGDAPEQSIAEQNVTDIETEADQNVLSPDNQKRWSAFLEDMQGQMTQATYNTHWGRASPFMKDGKLWIRAKRQTRDMYTDRESTGKQLAETLLRHFPESVFPVMFKVV